jgi:hypothetical protein
MIGEENMRSLTTYVVLLIFFATSGSVAQTQKPADKTGASASASASKEEVNELRSEVAAQRRTIEERKIMVKQLAEGKSQVAEADSGQTNLPAGDGVRLMNANLVEQAGSADKKPADKPADKKEFPWLRVGTESTFSSEARMGNFNCSLTDISRATTAATVATELLRIRF